MARICAHHFERRLSKTLTCQFKGQLLVVIARPERPRYALRGQTIEVIEHLDGALELLWGAEALPFKTFERHQHLSATRVAVDKLRNGRVDAVLVKESLRLRKSQALLAAENAQMRSRPSAAAI